MIIITPIDTSIFKILNISIQPMFKKISPGDKINPKKDSKVITDMVVNAPEFIIKISDLYEQFLNISPESKKWKDIYKEYTGYNYNRNLKLYSKEWYKQEDNVYKNIYNNILNIPNSTKPVFTNIKQEINVLSMNTEALIPKEKKMLQDGIESLLTNEQRAKREQERREIQKEQELIKQNEALYELLEARKRGETESSTQEERQKELLEGQQEILEGQQKIINMNKTSMFTALKDGLLKKDIVTSVLGTSVIGLANAAILNPPGISLFLTYIVINYFLLKGLRGVSEYKEQLFKIIGMVLLGIVLIEFTFWYRDTDNLDNDAFFYQYFDKHTLSEHRKYYKNVNEFIGNILSPLGNALEPFSNKMKQQIISYNIPETYIIPGAQYIDKIDLIPYFDIYHYNTEDLVRDYFGLEQRVQEQAWYSQFQFF